jgi:uracil-DNA glycosylase
MKYSQAALKEMGLWPLWKVRGAASADNAQLIDYKQKNIASDALSHTDRRSEILRMDWRELRASTEACTQCPLHKSRQHAVPGVGDEHAEWLFVGEAPGAEEDEQGEPFVGQAGKLLDNMLAAISLARGRNVYIANIVKCRPPENRNPGKEEAQACEPYLERQIQLIKPKLIIALGKVAAQNLLGADVTIANLRGKIHTVHGIPLIVTYHPAYLLRTLADKAKAWEDLCFARAKMRELSEQPAG